MRIVFRMKCDLVDAHLAHMTVHVTGGTMLLKFERRVRLTNVSGEGTSATMAWGYPG